MNTTDILIDRIFITIEFFASIAAFTLSIEGNKPSLTIVSAIGFMFVFAMLYTHIKYTMKKETKENE